MKVNLWGLNVRNSLNEITRDKARLRDYKSHTEETGVHEK